MPFINEYISDKDRKNYQIDEIDGRYVIGGVRSRQWTIDRERDIYLRKVAAGREEDSGRITWTFRWGGYLLEFTVDILEARGGVGLPCWTHMRIMRLALPDDLKHRRAEVIEDFREAMRAHRDGGVYSSCASYELQLDGE